LTSSFDGSGSLDWHPDIRVTHHVPSNNIIMVHLNVGAGKCFLIYAIGYSNILTLVCILNLSFIL
jgi:hypothetical protein